MRTARLALHVASLALGVAVALAAVLVHRVRLDELPWTTLLAVATSILVAWTLRTQGGRLAASYVAGWLVGFGVPLVGRSEGDFAVAGDLRGYVLIGTAFVLVAIAVASLVGQGQPGAVRYR